jgi:hypothetical protein
VKPILYWIVGIHGIYNVVNAVVRKFTGFSAQLTKSKEGSQAKPEVAAAAKAGAPLAFVETGQEALVSRYAEVLKLIGEGKTVPPSLVAKLSDARSLGLDTADANSVILEKAAEDLPPLLTQPKLHSSFMESLGMDAFSLAAKLMEGGPEIAGHRLVVRLVGDREEDIREALAMATTVGRLGGSRWSLVLNARDPGVLARLRAGTAGLHSVYFPDDSALGKKDWKATKVSFQKSGDIDPDAALEMIRTFKQILPSELWSDLLALVLGPVQRQDILIRLKAATVVLQYA